MFLVRSSNLSVSGCGARTQAENHSDHREHANTVSTSSQAHRSTGNKANNCVCGSAKSVKGCTEVDSARSGSGTSYLSESSARSSVRSRSPSMMTSLRATFRCSTTKCYSSARTAMYIFPPFKNLHPGPRTEVPTTLKFSLVGGTVLRKRPSNECRVLGATLGNSLNPATELKRRKQK